jgi:hypothetical protein
MKSGELFPGFSCKKECVVTESHGMGEGGIEEMEEIKAKIFKRQMKSVPYLLNRR